MASNNISNSTMKGKAKFQEVVKYKGDLRIIGTVIINNKIVGYVIMTEKNQQFKMYNEEQTKILLQRFKFVNAELSNGKIINTECSMNSIMKFNANMQVIDNQGVTILAKISLNGKEYGYRAMDHNAKIVDLTEDELIRLKQSGTNIINAKIVNKNGKEFVSAIKGEFTQIDKKSIEEIKVKKETPEELWRKERRRDKLENIWCHTILRKALVAEKASWFPYWAMTYKQGDYKTPADLNFGKTIEIMAKEIVPKYIKTDEHKRVFKKLLDTYLPSIDKHKYPSKTTANIHLAVGLAQFVLIGNENIAKRILNRPAELLSNSVYEQLYDKGMTIHEFEGLMLAMEKKYEQIHETKNNKTKKAFKTTQFKSAKDCAQIGFAINAKDKGLKYTTESGNNYTLKYIGDYLPGYDTYKKMAGCLGDVLVLAQIERLKEVTYFGEEEKLVREEIMLAVLSLYRPDIVKVYMENNKDRYSKLNMLPGVDLDSVTDFGLSDSLRIYYESGFNVFLNDNGMSGPFDKTYYNTRKYRRIHLINSEYINLRAFGAGVMNLHTSLYNELATIVGMITSDRVSIERLNSVIGCLRML